MSPPRRSKLSGRPAQQPEPGPPRRLPPPAPLRVDFSQAEARERRRNGFAYLVHHLDFDLTVEVRDRCAPLAAEVAELLVEWPFFLDPRCEEVDQPELLAPGFHVVRLAMAVNRLRAELAGVLAARLDAGGRARLAAVVRDPAHGRCPEVDNDSLRSGGWVDALVLHVEPLSADLAGVVAGQRAGFVSEFDNALAGALRGPDSFDQAVLELERRIPEIRRAKVSRLRLERYVAGQAAVRDRKRADDDLRRLRLT